MKQISKFKAIDGKLFDTEAECKKYEGYLTLIENAHAAIQSALDSSCDFANGGGFVQHNPLDLANFKSLVAQAIRSQLGDKHAQMFIDNPRGFIGRIIDDGDDKYLKGFIYRIWSIDNQNREWGQPFYAIESNAGRFPRGLKPFPTIGHSKLIKNQD